MQSVWVVWLFLLILLLLLRHKAFVEECYQELILSTLAIILEILGYQALIFLWLLIWILLFTWALSILTSGQVAILFLSFPEILVKGFPIEDRNLCISYQVLWCVVKSLLLWKISLLLLSLASLFWICWCCFLNVEAATVNALKTFVRDLFLVHICLLLQLYLGFDLIRQVDGYKLLFLQSCIQHWIPELPCVGIAGRSRLDLQNLTCIIVSIRCIIAWIDNATSKSVFQLLVHHSASVHVIVFCSSISVHARLLLTYLGWCSQLSFRLLVLWFNMGTLSI